MLQMIKHMYLTKMLLTAWRHLSKGYVHSIIAIASLAIGLAGAILILGHLRFELMYDRWVPGAERMYTYRVLSEISTAGGSHFRATSPFGALDLPAHIPGVAAATAIGESPLHFLKGDAIQELAILMAQPAFFDFFPLAVRAGDAKAALSAPANVVLTEASARRLLGPGDAVGKTVMSSDGRVWRVGAVVAPLPEQTHFAFDALVPLPNPPEGPREWAWGGGQRIFVKLAEPGSIDLLRPTIEAFTRERIGAPGASAGTDAPPIEINLCPLVRLHIHDDVLCTSFEKPPVEPGRLKALAAIGFGILVLGTMNFANIALARSLGRGREAALRKLLGASRGRLVRQFLGESLGVAAVSLGAGLALAAIFGEPFGALVGQGESRVSLDATVILGAALLAALAGISGGIYPALIVSGQTPASILVGARERLRGSRLRLVLVAMQFTLAIGLTVAAIVVWQQSRHIGSADLGFDAEGVVVVRAGPDEASTLRAMETALGGHRAILGIARASGGPGIAAQGFLEVTRPGRAEPLNMVNYRVGAAFFDIYRLVPRRPPGAPPLDLSWGAGGAMINEAAARALGFTTAGDAIGASLSRRGRDGAAEALHILGVVPDYTGIRAATPPYIFTPARDDEDIRYLAARLAPGREEEGLAAIDRFWRTRVPEEPVDRYFVGQRLAGFLDGYRRNALSFGVAAGLALALAATGLFGIAALTVERRRREIAVRKVFGARLGNLLGPLLRQLLAPVLPSMLLAWAVSWYFLRDWLEGFLLRVELTPLPFALAGLGAVLVGGLTVIGHAARAAALCPTRALRIE